MEPESEWTSPPRDVPTPWPLPRPAERRRRRPRSGGTEIERWPADPGVPPDGPVDEREPEPDEPPWVRERREEAEFAREFGDWRAGSGSRASRAGMSRAGMSRAGMSRAGMSRPARRFGMVPVLLVLVALALVLVVAL